MRYVVHHLGHMPVGARFCLSRVKIVPGFDGRALEVHDSEFDAAYYPTRKEAARSHKELTMTAPHPIYGFPELDILDDADVAEWLGQQGKAIVMDEAGESSPVEDRDAWFSGLHEEDKTLFRVAYMNAQPSAQRLNIENLIGMDLSVLASVVDMAERHVEDILSGLEDGTYEKEENKDIDQKVEALGKLQEFMAANL